MTTVRPLRTVWCASFQYARRTTSRYSGSTYSLQISSGSLMCASQSKTGKRFWIRPSAVIGRLARENVSTVGLHRRELPRLRWRRAAGERALDVRRQLLRLPPPARLVPLLEFRHDPRREQLERLADVLVAVVPALLDEDRLVDAGFLERPQVVAHLLGRADAAAAAGHRDLIAAEGLPDAR